MNELTVKELIALLKKADQEDVVKIEGCDCIANAVGIENNPGFVLIMR